MSLADTLAAELLDRPRELIEDWPTFRAERLPGIKRVIVARSGYTEQVRGSEWKRYVQAADWPYIWRHLVPGYLDHIMAAGGRKMAINHYSERRYLELPAPLYYAGGTYEGDWSYVDIAHCYYSIYRLLGTYNPGVSIRDDSIQVLRGRVEFADLDIFAGDKEAEHALAGFPRTQRWHERHYGELVEVEGITRRTSPTLWAVVALVLNSLALDAIGGFGAIYAYTDGFIVPGEKEGPFRDHLASWGLGSHVKGRGGTVRGRGAYTLGTCAEGKLDGDGLPRRTLVDLSPAARESLRVRLNR